MVQITSNFQKIFKRKDTILSHGFQKQFLVSFVVNIITFSHGIALGWAAPTLRKLSSDDSPLDFKISIVEASWIASLVGLGSVLGNLVLCNLIDVIGRKPCLLIMALPNICLWILIYVANSVEYLYAARFIGGITGGSSIAVIPLFINEIADAEKRGAFQAFFTIALNFGILIGYILSSNLSYHLIPCIAVGLPIIFLLLLSHFPETPHYLIRKNEDEKAMISLQFYKNYKEIASKCQQDFRDLKTAINDSRSGSQLRFKDFITKPALKAYSIVLILLITNQFSGIYVFVTYMSDIFAISSSPFEPNTCTIVLGVVQLFGNFATMFFIDHCGRKMLIVISSIGVIIGLTAFGLFTHLKSSSPSISYTWIPLVLMMFIIFIGNIGIVSVTVISVVEVLPLKIRSTAFSCFLALLSFLVFVALKIFPIFMHTFGISLTMWSCAGITATCLLYLIIFLPETKGKSMIVDK